MKTNRILFSALILSCILIHSNAIGQTRESINLDSQWKFRLGTSSGAEMPGFDDSAWDIISLPHTWNSLDGQDGNGYERKTGWYRKKLNIPSEYQGRRLFLRFGAANLVATVYINGNEIGIHRGGYAAFIYDVTSSVTYNAVNSIAVRVDNTNSDKIAPLSADFTFCGGLTRSVQLLVTGPIAISLMDYASSGIYITQNNVNDATANVSVKVLINNYTASGHSINKIINIKDAHNNLIATDTEPLNLAANTRTDKTRSLIISNPILWNGRLNPYLYKVEVLLQENNIVKDSLSQPLGLRYFNIMANSGFYLNGKPYSLHGVNLHEDRLNKGRAISNADRLEDMNILNELGVNFIRLSHYQHDQYTYDLADKNGIVLWTEIPLINKIDNTELFTSNIKEQLKELIRQNYNHPSVFFWGLYNEILQEAGPDPLSLMNDLNTLAHAEDATRLTTVASNRDNTGINEVADLVSFNKYHGWYFDTPQVFDSWLSGMHANPLPLPVGLSEYGAGASIIHHELYPVMPNVISNWHPEELLNNFHEQYWKSIEKYSFLWQTSLWVAFDFSSDDRNEGDKPGINDKGLVTHDRKTKKDAFYFYKSHWSEEPVIYITSRRFNERSEAETYIKAYSNCDSVKLLINNNSYGIKRTADHIFLWEGIVLEPGVNMIRIKGYRNHGIFADSCIWRYDALKAEKTIRINFQTSTTKTPAGYLADSGEAYGPKGNGHLYGWHVDNTLNARERNMWTDKLYDAFNHFQKNSPANYWEIALKNGTYLVRIASGDPQFNDSYFKLLAESKVILNGTPTTELPWIVNEDTVMIKDGKLTIRAATEAINSKINFIHITRIDSINLGFGKKVSQSSTSNYGKPERAIDGNTNGLWDNGSVTHTFNDLNAWWEMDLGDSYHINTLELWNRTDNCCKARLSNFYVFVSNEPFVSGQLNATLSQPGIWSDFRSDFPNPANTFVVNRTARYVRIQLAGTGELNIAEVILMGSLNLAPSAPSGLTIADSSSGFNLQWKDNSNNELGFTIERKQENANFGQITNVSQGTESYIDLNNLNPGTSYTYRIKAFNNAGASDYSNIVTVTIPSVAVSENVALHKQATQSSTRYGGVPGRAVDGNTDGMWDNASVTHTFGDLNAWWEVDLGDIYTVSTVEIWNRTNSCCMARLSNYYVIISDEPFQSRQLNTTLNQPGIWFVFRSDFPNPSGIFDVHRTARYVRIQLAGTAELNIAEVRVMVSSQVPQPEPVNVALHKLATQSSTNYGGIPDRAVDGNTDGMWDNGSVTHTSGDLNAWWEVDLGDIYNLNTIEIWNRTNSCCMARLSDFYTIVSNEPFQSRQLNATLNQPGIWSVFKSNYPNPEDNITVNRTGRYIRVQLSGTGELSIAEIKAMGSVTGLNSKSSGNSHFLPDSDSMNISVYPIPFNDVILIRSDKIMNTIELINILGEELLSIKCRNESAEIHTYSLKPGLYFIRIYSTDNQIKTFRVIKSK